jgi:Ca2+/Na+ antiporter
MDVFVIAGDTFGPANNIGVGTIVGSAMFNILVIVALSAAAAEGPLKIDWRPVYRDVFFYSLSVTLFMIFSADEEVHA